MARAQKTAKKTAKTTTRKSTKSTKSTKASNTQNSQANATAGNAFNNAFTNASQAYTNPFANGSFNYGNINPADYLNNLMSNKAMSGFKTANTEQLMATAQKNLETSIAAGQRVLGSFKEVAEKQAAFFSSFFQDGTSAMQDILTSNADPKRKLEDTSEAVKDSMERLAANTRDTMKYMEKTATDVSNLLNKRMSDCLDEIKDAA